MPIILIFFLVCFGADRHAQGEQQTLASGESVSEGPGKDLTGAGELPLKFDWRAASGDSARFLMVQTSARLV
ncbi:MAG: hypothetical protein HY645_13050 [Acidobacteria bacterium]|nr:hypothetical protein [Acidobacteriota bacterium]